MFALICSRPRSQPEGLTDLDLIVRKLVDGLETVDRDTISLRDAPEGITRLDGDPRRIGDASGGFPARRRKLSFCRGRGHLTPSGTGKTRGRRPRTVSLTRLLPHLGQLLLKLFELILQDRPCPGHPLALGSRSSQFLPLQIDNVTSLYQTTFCLPDSTLQLSSRDLNIGQLLSTRLNLGPQFGDGSLSISERSPERIDR